MLLMSHYSTLDFNLNFISILMSSSYVSIYAQTLSQSLGISNALHNIAFTRINLIASLN